MHQCFVLVALIASVLTSGVASSWGSADIAIYDFTKSAVIGIASNRWREVVIDASPKQTNFFTITRLDAPKLIIRERGENGTILSELELPFFVSGYAGHNWIKMSPDHKRIAFHNSETKGLSVLALQSRQQRDFLQNEFNFQDDILLMRWLSTNTVLLLKGKIGAEVATTGQILKINVDSGEIQSWPRSLDGTMTAHALGQSGRFLATVGYDRGSKIVILDVATMKETKELPAVKPDQWIADVWWLDDDKRLAFSDVGNGVFCYSMNTGEINRITPEGNRRYFLEGAIGKCVVLRKQSLWSLGRPRFVLQDVVTGKSTTLDAYLNGFVYGIAGNTKFVMEVGY